MPFLPKAVVIKAAVESTRRYLAFLRDAEVGVAQHRATNILSREAAGSFFENSLWQTYSCRLPPRLQHIPSNSSATLKPHAAPGAKLEIRILDYDPLTGKTTFATREPVSGATGNIVIDFSWLVKRCLTWFQQRGVSIPEFAGPHAHEPEVALWAMPFVGLNMEQSEAVRTILRASLSYVWGPPGTGKTKRVLAKAACRCVDNNQKVLVLALTNLGVDNALTAILEEGVEKEKVARIGIPSKLFFQKFPECCEERASRHEIGQIRSQIKAREDSIAALEKAKRLKKQIEERTTELERKHRDLTQDNTDLALVEENLRESRATTNQLQRNLRAAEARLDALRRELDQQSFPKRVSDITALESEQTRSIRKRQDLEEELRNLGLLTRIFTDRRRKLRGSVSRENDHLLSIEATLKNKRKERDELAPRNSQLQMEIAKLDSIREAEGEKLLKSQIRDNELEKRQRELQNRISRTLDDARRLEAETTRANEELSAIGEGCRTGLTDDLVPGWQEEIRQLQDRLSRLKLDLSSKPVLGMTLDGFIGLTLQMSITVDRVLIDESPYAPLAKVLPVLSLRCPIALLGDHLQLPPVCQNQNDAIIRAYWGKRATFLEDAFRIGGRWSELDALEEPRFELTQRCDLTKSYRFGQSLASLLDRHIYKMGLTGLSPHDTAIRCIHCEPRDRVGREGRENDAEADAIIEHIEKWWTWAQAQSALPTIAILTPYKNQVHLIRKKLYARIGNSPIASHVEILNTHQAQGREWDWVLFSASDTGNLPGNGPWFSDTATPQGRAVVNTTVSRSKQHLRIFLDATYWKGRMPQSLLTELLA